MTFRQCIDCGQMKELRKEFYVHRRYENGKPQDYDHRCKKCYNRNRWRRHGISYTRRPGVRRRCVLRRLLWGQNHYVRKLHPDRNVKPPKRCTECRRVRKLEVHLPIMERRYWSQLRWVCRFCNVKLFRQLREAK